MASWLCNHWEFVVEFFISLGVLAVLIKLVTIPLSRPRVRFYKYRIGGGYEGGQVFCWYIPVMNERRNNWLRFFCQREDAVDCRVKVRFTTPEDVLVYNYAEWWNGAPVGKTLEPGVLHEFPLAFVDTDGEVHLAGTPVKTGTSAIPLQSGSDVIAHVKVTSKRKVLASSKWRIKVKHSRWTPIHVERLQE
jgi:hypothetical protein